MQRHATRRELSVPGVQRIASAVVNDGHPREWRCGEYVISDDPARFDADAMHDFLQREAYWAKGRSRETTVAAVTNSVVLGVYGPDGAMVGGARIVTDRATFGYLSDVYVLAAHRGRGLGTAVVTAACEHPAVAGIKRLMLITADAHELYRPFGFTELRQPEGWMELRPVPGDGPGAAVDGTGAAPGRGDARSGAAEHGSGTDGSGHEHGSGTDGSGHAGSRAAATSGAHDLSDGPRAYAAWQGGGLADPRTAPVSRVAEHLLEIVTVEGPVTADRAYRLYIRGAGSSKVTQRARAPMEQALGRLRLRGQVEVEELDNAGESQQVLRLTGTPAVVVRELGERSLYEVPLNEIAELMRHKRHELMGRAGGQPAHAVAGVIQQAALRRASPDRLMRAVLDAYDLIRMTQAAEQYLTAALTLLDDSRQ